VLDIGCGGGLLSMMAARAGARHVYACEVHELVHHQAQKVIAQNGYSDKITTINKVSNALEIGEDLPEKADIIVAEVFDTGLLGEEALRTFEHAREHLLKPNGVILPVRASVQAVLIESALLQNEAVTTRCCGFDATHMNELSPSYIQTRLDAFAHKKISDVKTIFDFDFSQNIENQIKQVEFEITETSLCHGVCFWFTLDFGQQIKMSTGPKNRWNCWMQAFSAFATPVSVTGGKSLNVTGRHTQNRVYFECR
jgi:predicted RNA methylase